MFLAAGGLMAMSILRKRAKNGFIKQQIKISNTTKPDL